MKIDLVTCIWMFVYAINFSAPRNEKKLIFDFSGPSCVSYRYFIWYFVCKYSFREISMTKMVILDQSKPISQILKNKKSKIQKSKICKLHICYS